MNRFTKINEGFICQICQKNVPPATRTCRNHCPFCLHSVHVDVYPGDRANECKGLMRPIGYEQTGHKGLMIRFECSSCGAKTRNIALLDDKNQNDDYELILSLRNN
jgi:hypothetical protein